MLEDLVDAVALAGRQAGEQRLPERLVARPARARDSRTRSAARTRVGFWNFRPMPACAISGSVSVSRSMRRPNQADPVIRARLAGDDVHHGGLAGAVRADDAAQLSRLDVQRQRVERLEAVEADGQLLEIENLAVAQLGLVRAARRDVEDSAVDWAGGLGTPAGGRSFRLPQPAAAHQPARQEQRHQHEQRAERVEPDFREARR